MTNFSGTAVQLKEFAALQNFWHATNGIYLWEYVTTLDFELDIIRGRRSYRWTIWVAAYVSLINASLLIIVRMYVTVSFNSSKPGPSFPNQALIEAFSIAIWNKNKFAVAIAGITWVTNVSLAIRGKLIYLQLRATRHPILQICVILNSEEIKPTHVTTLITDTILLVTMLVGLFRLLTDSSSAFGLGRLLWKQ
ncbi:hypothetical protein F5888DRAFT_1891854, partial [Russula emetica]